MAEEPMGYLVLPPQALVTRQTATVMKCVELFEGGAETIYLVDEQGRYCWQAARKGHCHFALDADGSWQLTMEPLRPIIFDLPITQETLPQLREIGMKVFSAVKGATELPIVDSGGGSCSLRADINPKEKDIGLAAFS